jgi:hypothetical protein
VIVEIEDDAGQLTVWDSGEAELEVMTVDGTLTSRHYEGL